jgi:hypothetical protein
MTAEERELMKKWVETWKTTGPILERLRREDVRNANTGLAIQHLSGLVLPSLQQYPAKPTSGLIEQQALFKKLHQR